MTPVTMQSNEVVSSEVRDKEALPEPSYRKKLSELFDQPN